MSEKKHIIDEWFDEIEDPIVTNWNLISLMESWIDYSVFDDHEKENLKNKITNLRESEVSRFLDFLNDHRIWLDPRDQFKIMVKNGVIK